MDRVMASTRENSYPSGYFGLPLIHGSITIISPEGSWNWNVPCPSQVICILRSFYGGGAAGDWTARSRNGRRYRSFQELTTVVICWSSDVLGASELPRTNWKLE